MESCSFVAAAWGSAWDAVVVAAVMVDRAVVAVTGGAAVDDAGRSWSSGGCGAGFGRERGRGGRGGRV